MMKHHYLLSLGALLAGPALAQAPVTFAPVSTPSTGTGSRPTSVAVADVNGDGKPDVLTTNTTTNTVGVLLGSGSGTFTLQANSPSTGANTFPFAIAVADVNGDGKPDVLTVNPNAYTVSLLLGNGNGGFALQANSPSTGASGPAFAMVVADVNGDGRPDVFTANSSNSTVSVLLGNGSGGFALQANSPGTGPNSSPIGITVADANGDGKPDLLTANQNTGTVGVLLGDGGGGFTLQANSPSLDARSFPRGVAVADVNGDGKPDLLTSNENTSTVSVLLGNGSGGFVLQANSPSTGPNSVPRSLVVADVNGDGKPDVVTANQNTDNVAVLLGNGNGGFALQANPPSVGTSSQPFSLVVGDVNGDGKPDLLTANYGSDAVGVLLNATPLPIRAALPGASATLCPNPARTSTTFSATGLPIGVRTVEATLLSPVGQVVRRQRVPVALGAATASLATMGLAAGLYLLHLTAFDGQGAALGVMPVQRLSME